MIHVIATIKCRSGHRDSFLAEFHKIVPLVLQEPGCLEYGPTVDTEAGIENQNRDVNRVTIIEKWESTEALAAHLVAPHMLDYRPKVKEFVEFAELRVLESA